MQEWKLTTTKQSSPLIGMQIKNFVLNQLRALYSNVVFDAVLRFNSHPMTVSAKRCVVFAPHQDDETFGCGGLIAMKKALGATVKIIFLTDGSRSHTHLPEASREHLVRTRRSEAIAAAKALGLSEQELTFLSHPDGGLGEMSGDEKRRAVEQLSLILHETAPEEIYVTHRHDKHGDHEASFDLVMRAMALAGIRADVLEYAIWAVWWSAFGFRLKASDLAGARVLNITSVREKKYKAMQAYGSQLDVLPPGFVRRFHRNYEFYFSTPKGAQGKSSDGLLEVA